jgi:uncharacterized protein YkwD
MTAFVNSPAHLRNIVDPSFNYIGVGVSYDAEGRMYTTHDFMALDDGSSGDSSSEPAPDQTSDQTSAPTPKPSKQASVAPATDSAPVADVAAAEPPPPPTAPATSARVQAVLTALRAVGN